LGADSIDLKETLYRVYTEMALRNDTYFINPHLSLSPDELQGALTA